MTRPKSTHKIRLAGDFASRRVWLGTQELVPGPSQRIVNHSPDGFAWGYSGSGPAQLALAVMLMVCKDSTTALRFYQIFKREVISILPNSNFSIMIDVTKYAEA